MLNLITLWVSILTARIFAHLAVRRWLFWAAAPSDSLSSHQIIDPYKRSPCCTQTNVSPPIKASSEHTLTLPYFRVLLHVRNHTGTLSLPDDVRCVWSKRKHPHDYLNVKRTDISRQDVKISPAPPWIDSDILNLTLAFGFDVRLTNKECIL